MIRKCEWIVNHTGHMGMSKNKNVRRGACVSAACGNQHRHNSTSVTLHTQIPVDTFFLGGSSSG